MKLVQFLRPLFLVALGLHALVLFLPVGEEEPVIEDIALEELAGNKVTPSQPPVPGVLPVPDPNVSTADTAAKPKSASTNAVAARPPVNPRTATSNAASSGSRRSTSASSQRRAASGAGGDDSRSASNRSSRNRTSSNNSSEQNNDAAQNNASNRDENANDSSARSSQSNQSSGPNNDTTIAVVTPQDNNGSNSENSASDGASNGSNTASSRASMLIAQATRNLPGSLKELAAKLDRSLTYNPSNTEDDPDVQKVKDNWQAELQAQANVGQIELMPPTEIIELTQIEYPIESSLVVEGRSLRRCLAEDPKTAEIGVRFDAQGNIAGEPKLLRSTGYSAINEEIKALVASYDNFPSDRASKAYTFEVEIFYDSELCITAEALQE